MALRGNHVQKFSLLLAMGGVLLLAGCSGLDSGRLIETLTGKAGAEQSEERQIDDSDLDDDRDDDRDDVDGDRDDIDDRDDRDDDRDDRDDDLDDRYDRDDDDVNPAAQQQPVTLPSCDVMNAVAQQEYEDFGPEHFSSAAGETDLYTFNMFAGEHAVNAMAATKQMNGCRWPVHFEGNVIEYVAELPAVDQAPMIAALRADETITETRDGDALVFNYVIYGTDPRANDTKVSYMFLGDVWVAIFDYAGQRTYDQAALDAVRSANSL